MTQIHSITGERLDPRITALEQTPGFWIGRASVRQEEAQLWYPTNRHQSARHAAIAYDYRAIAMRLGQ